LEDTTGRFNMELGMVSAIGKEQPWLKTSVGEDLTWWVGQQESSPKGANVYNISKHLRANNHVNRLSLLRKRT
jgi:hypothetical protein